MSTIIRGSDNFNTNDNATQTELNAVTNNISTRPVMSGQMGTAMTSPSADTTLLFDEFWVQIGITYSAGKFYVPEQGIYRITMNPFFRSGTGVGRVYVGVNSTSPTSSSHYGHAYKGSNDYDTLSINSIVALNAGDFIIFRLSQGAIYNQTNDRFNQFTIERIR